MICYTCDQTPPTATMRYTVANAVGICHECGIGVCAEHSYKSAKPGSPLLCISCAGLHGIVVPDAEAANR